MKKKFLSIICALLIMSCSNAASAQDSSGAIEKVMDEALQKMALTGKTPEDFVPAGWDIHSQAEGDLNGDGLNDYALDLSPKEARGESFAEVVIVLFAEKGVNLRRFAMNRSLSPCTGSGFECSQNLTIKQGVLTANSNFGNNHATDVTYFFRFDKAASELMLIGFADETYTRAGNEDGYVTSYNFLTGMKEEKRNYVDRRRNPTRVYSRSSVKRSRFKSKKVTFAEAPLGIPGSG